MSSAVGELHKVRLLFALFALIGLAECHQNGRNGALVAIKNDTQHQRPHRLLAAVSAAPIPYASHHKNPIQGVGKDSPKICPTRDVVHDIVHDVHDIVHENENERSFIADGTCWLYNAQPELCDTLYYTSPGSGVYQRCRFSSNNNTCQRGPALGCEPQCSSQPSKPFSVLGESQPTMVFGVASPGIGVGINSGLSNMQQMLVGLVLLAQEHGAAISLPTLLLRSTYRKEDKYVPYSEFFDVARWHALTCKGLPSLTDAPPQHVYSSKEIWKRHEQYISEIRSNSSIPPRSRFEDFVMDATSHPSARIRKLIAQVAPPQPYACLHARIETDMNRQKAMSTHTEQMHFPWLAEQLRANKNLRKDGENLAALFVAVDLKDVTPEDKEAMDEGVWPGVPLAFAGEPAASGQSGILPDEAPIVGAIVDKSICIDAQFFVGWPGSTFANTLVYSRILAGHGRKSNWYYNLADGVRQRDDDGRGGSQAPADI